MSNPEINELLKEAIAAQNDLSNCGTGSAFSYSASNLSHHRWESFYRAIELHQNFTAIGPGEYRNDVAQVLNFSGTLMRYADRYGIEQSFDLSAATSIELNTYPGEKP